MHFHNFVTIAVADSAVVTRIPSLDLIDRWIR
jgi:hypothetical protein